VPPKGIPQANGSLGGRYPGRRRHVLDAPLGDSLRGHRRGPAIRGPCSRQSAQRKRAWPRPPVHGVPRRPGRTPGPIGWGIRPGRSSPRGGAMITRSFPGRPGKARQCRRGIVGSPSVAGRRSVGSPLRWRGAADPEPPLAWASTWDCRRRGRRRKVGEKAAYQLAPETLDRSCSAERESTLPNKLLELPRGAARPSENANVTQQAPDTPERSSPHPTKRLSPPGRVIRPGWVASLSGGTSPIPSGPSPATPANHPPSTRPAHTECPPYPTSS